MDRQTAASQETSSTGHLHRRLVLIRHGETDEKARGRLIGRTDVSLSAAGRRAAAELGGPVGRFLPALCFVSPLRRARETAELALGSANVELRIEDWLREIDFGRWEGQTFEAVQAADPELVRAWVHDESQFRFPEGESIEEFFARVTVGAGRIAAAWERHETGADPLSRPTTTIVFAHAGVIRGLLCQFLEISPYRNRMFHIEHAALAVVDTCDGMGTLRALNQYRSGLE